MKILNVAIHERDLRKVLSPYLEGHFFHATTFENWLMIKSCGYLTGKDVNGSLCPQRTSYGSRRGYICIFDWKNNSKETIREQSIKLNPFDPFGHSCDPVFVIFKNDIESNIIPNNVAVLETEYREMFVPHIECWHSKDIQLNTVKTVLIAEFHREKETGLFSP